MKHKKQNKKDGGYLGLLYNLISGFMKLITTVIILYVIYKNTTPEGPVNWVIGFGGMFWAIYPLIKEIIKE